MRMNKEITLDDTRYLLSQYSGGKAMRLFAKLMKIGGKSIGIMMGAGLDATIKPEMLGDAIQAMSGSLEPNEFEALVKEILDGTLIFDEQGNNRKLNPDVDLAGRFLHGLKLLKEVLVYQYDFLGKIVTDLPAAVAIQKPTTKAKIKAI